MKKIILVGLCGACAIALLVAATGPVLQGVRVLRETNGEATALLVRGGLRLANVSSGRVGIYDANGTLTNGPVTTAELLFLSGVTSAIQGQLDSKPSNATLVGSTNNLSNALIARMDAATNALAGVVETRVLLATNGIASYVRTYTDAATNASAGYARSYADAATNALSGVLRTRMDAGTNDLNTVLRALIATSTNTAASTGYVDAATNALAGASRAYADAATNALNGVLRTLITSSTNNNLASANAYADAATNVNAGYTRSYANSATNALAGAVAANMNSTSNTLYGQIGNYRHPYVGVSSSVIDFDSPHLTNTITGTVTYSFANQSNGDEVDLAIFSAAAQTVNFPAISDTFAWYAGAVPPSTLTGTNFFKFKMIGAKVWGAYISPLFIGNRTPSSASDTGNAGDIAWDNDYIYVCIAANTWKRVAIATW